jgi:hypothetical protein
VAAAVIAGTGGTPLALKEVGAQLTVEQRLGFEPVPEPLPVGERLLTLYQDRIRPLDRDTHLALAAAAAAGSAHHSIPPALQAMTLSQELFAAAESVNVVHLGLAGPVFPHPLLRAASLAVLSPAERRQIHSALAGISNRLEGVSTKLSSAAREDERPTS